MLYIEIREKNERFYFKYLSSCLFIMGTKIRIQRKTVGQAKKNLCIKLEKK